MNEANINNELGAAARNSRQRCRRAVDYLKHERKVAQDGFAIRREDVEPFLIGQWRWRHG
jgi:hypothetical protein